MPMPMTKRAGAVWLVVMIVAATGGGGGGGKGRGGGGGVRAEEPAGTRASTGSCAEGGGGGGGGDDGRGGTCKVDDAKIYDLGDSHGWFRYDSSFDGPCTIDRVRASEISFRSFTRTYKNKKPVVIVDMKERNEAFRRLSSRDRLLRDWGDKRIVLSTANTHSYDKHVKTLREYATHHMQPQRLDVSGDKTLYWFGDNNHTEWASHFDVYVPPPFIPKSAAVALSFGVGGPHSGVPLHIHGPGFSETIIGRKRWWLSPPKPKPKFNPNATALEWALGLKPSSTAAPAEGRGGENQEDKTAAGAGGRLEVEAADDDAEWVHTPKHYLEENAEKDGGGGSGAEVLECTVGEGEAVYFPDGWWHATLNLDESVFMSSFVNYKFGGGNDPDELFEGSLRE